MALKDFLGHTIREGYTVVYPVRRGSSHWLEKGVIERIQEVKMVWRGTEFEAPSQFSLKVRPDPSSPGSSRIRHIKSLDRVVVVVE